MNRSTWKFVREYIEQVGVFWLKCLVIFFLRFMFKSIKAIWNLKLFETKEFRTNVETPPSRVKNMIDACSLYIFLSHVMKIVMQNTEKAQKDVAVCPVVRWTSVCIAWFRLCKFSVQFLEPLYSHDTNTNDSTVRLICNSSVPMTKENVF